MTAYLHPVLLFASAFPPHRCPISPRAWQGLRLIQIWVPGVRTLSSLQKPTDRPPSSQPQQPTAWTSAKPPPPTGANETRRHRHGRRRHLHDQVAPRPGAEQIAEMIWKSKLGRSLAKGAWRTGVSCKTVLNYVLAEGIRMSHNHG